MNASITKLLMGALLIVVLGLCTMVTFSVLKLNQVIALMELSLIHI